MGKKEKNKIVKFVSIAEADGMAYDINGSLIMLEQRTRYCGRDVVYYKVIRQNGNGPKETQIPGYQVGEPVSNPRGNMEYKIARVSSKIEKRDISELLRGIEAVALDEKIEFW